MSNKKCEMVACVHCQGQYKDHWRAKQAHADDGCEGTANEIAKAKSNTTSVPAVENRMENKGGDIAQVKDEPKIKNEADRKLYELGKKSLETRKEAPELYVSGQHSDERWELIKRYAPECMDPPYRPQDGKNRKFAAWHPYWSDGSDVNKSLTAGRGYLPVFNEHDEHVTHKGDKLWKIPTKMYLDSKYAASVQSASRVRKEEDEEMKELREKSKKDGVLFDAERTTEKIE